MPDALSTIEARTAGGGLYPSVKHAMQRLRETLSRETGHDRRLTDAVLAFELAAVAYLDGRYHLAVLNFLRAAINSPDLVRNTLSRVSTRLIGDMERAVLAGPARVPAPVAALSKRPTALRAPD